jgi:DNA-binding GntR family transcriptional regulator
VTIMPQSGARVFTLSAREVREICQFRRALEGFAVGLALEHRPEAFEKAIADIVDRVAAARAEGDAKTYLKLDTRFHLAFFDHCGNGYLQQSYELFSGKIAALRTHLATKPDHTKLSFEEHQRILAAIRKRKTATVRRVLEQHIGRTQETYEIGIEDIAAADDRETATQAARVSA